MILAAVATDFVTADVDLQFVLSFQHFRLTGDHRCIKGVRWRGLEGRRHFYTPVCRLLEKGLLQSPDIHYCCCFTWCAIRTIDSDPDLIAFALRVIWQASSDDDCGWMGNWKRSLLLSFPPSLQKWQWRELSQ